MKKRSLAALLLAVVVVCGGFFIFNQSEPMMLENQPNMPELHEGEMLLVDESIPLAGLPVEGVPGEGEVPAEEDPFKDFTEEEVKMINEIFEKVNAERAAVGMPELKLNPTLCKAAMVRAGECVQVFSHTRPNGSRYRTAIEEAGLQSVFTGENVASGYTSAGQVMKGWMASPGHQENILRERFNEIGIGMVKNTGNGYRGYAWCQLFME